MFTVKYAAAEDKPYFCDEHEHLSEREFYAKVRDRRCFVICLDEQRIGRFRYNLMFDFIPFLTHLFIIDPYKRQGFGTKAMLFWEEEMRKLGHKMVMTSTQVNEEGQHFYRKLGYKDMGAIVMDIPPYEQPLEMFLCKKL